MPYRPEVDTDLPPAPHAPENTPDVAWRRGLPSLAGAGVTLRDLRPGDAASLFACLTSEQVSRFISPPPSTVEGFERFISWSSRQRESGQYVCFAVVAHGSEAAVGIFQVRSLEPAFGTAEWGFALAAELWGTGIFTDAAHLVLTFAFDVLGTRRLEARAAVRNGRGNGALRKLGATMEGVLRKSLHIRGEHVDQALWTILRSEWLDAKAVQGPRIVH